MAGRHPDKNAWKQMWGAGFSPWHKTDVNRLLEKHYHLANIGEGKKKWYIPLCGKSVDMKWLSDKGHTVVGAELEEIAARSFFEEQNISYDIVPCPKVEGQLFKSQQGDIRIYCCDVLNLNNEVEGSFDAVWDRGAMEAMPEDLRPKYTGLMRGMLAPSAHILLSTSNYDNTEFKGPPCIISEEEVRHNFGADFKVVKVDESEVDESEVPRELKELGQTMTDVIRHIYRE